MHIGRKYLECNNKFFLQRAVAAAVGRVAVTAAAAATAVAGVWVGVWVGCGGRVSWPNPAATLPHCRGHPDLVRQVAGYTHPC